MNPLQSAKLTKKFLMGLPGGVFIISNLLQSLDASMFEEYVEASLPEREKQWKKIVSLDCNNKLCHIFKNVAQAKEWIKNPDSSPPQ